MTWKCGKSESSRPDPRPVLLAFSTLAFVCVSAFIMLYARLGGVFVGDMEKSIGEVLLADGIRLENATDYDNAIQTYRLAIENHFTHQVNRTEALRRLGTVLSWRESMREGLPYLEQAYRNGGFSIWLYEPYCDGLLDAGRVDEALELAGMWFARAVNEGRADLQAHAKNREGKCRLKRGERQLALEAFLAGHAVQPGGANAYDAGVLFFEMGDTVRALQLLDVFLRDAAGPQAEYARRLCERLRQKRE